MTPSGRDLETKFIEGAMRALLVIGEDLLGKAVPLAPIEVGDLRASAALAFLVNESRFEGEGAYEAAKAAAVSAVRAGIPTRVDVEVSFNTVYAAAQHEGLDFEHPLGGQAKYLEQPLRENAHRYLPVMDASIRRELAAD